ncbi:MAG: zinc ribbon domain-containing protein, partial [Scardovia wiggsiae]|nr:zinc ribbon domain-containing protein [Scardovia wiggsiae]
MPTYHYCCRNCGYDFTEVRSFNDYPLTRSPRCGQ